MTAMRNPTGNVTAMGPPVVGPLSYIGSVTKSPTGGKMRASQWVPPPVPSKHVLSDAIPDKIYVRNDHQKQAVLAVFKKHGVTTLPDGRKVKDIIHNLGDPLKKTKIK